MKPYLGPAGKPDYQRTMYRANMQGADHGAFIGYLLGELQELHERVVAAEAELAKLTRGASLSVVGVAVAPHPELEVAPPVVAEVKPVEPPAPANRGPVNVNPADAELLDSDVLKHIVVEIEPTPNKKRGK